MNSLAHYIPGLLQGLWTTILIGTINIVLMMLIGLILLAGIRSGIGWLSRLTRILTDLVRASSVIVILFWLFYALPLLPGEISLSGPTATILAISIGAGAFAADILRSAANSIPKGQFDACEALRLGFWRRECRIVFPQMLGIALPSLATLAGEIFKWSALGSLVGVPDLIYWGEAARTKTGQTLLIYGGLLTTYYILTQTIFWLFRLAGVRPQSGSYMTSLFKRREQPDDLGLPFRR